MHARWFTARTLLPLRAAKACKVDAEKFCNVTWFFGYKAGQVTSCLRDVKGQVSKGCKAELFKVMKDVSRRMRADARTVHATAVGR